MTQGKNWHEIKLKDKKVFDYDGSTLLLVHRQYSKEEAFNVLINETKAMLFVIGELKSENEELRHSLQKGLEAMYALYKSEKVEFDKNKVNRLRQDKNYWKAKYFELLGKQHIENSNITP